MKPIRHSLALMVLVGASHTVQAQETLEIVVPFAAGGATDIVARSFEPIFSEKLGVTSVVRNLAGASATVGTSEVAKSEGQPQHNRLRTGWRAQHPALLERPFLRAGKLYLYLPNHIQPDVPDGVEVF